MRWVYPLRPSRARIGRSEIHTRHTGRSAPIILCCRHTPTNNLMGRDTQTEKTLVGGADH
ncbi:hypothetical protein NWFMUON74_07360 [Nocardia wallacei]|uniref:Uncharacterized protein n=1 Tax=Nocardia wallacei TaxID=480035 RepID=A0A7G1KHL6_9NOCA|nr:hypothetical protein NWFMUON74_07360 [Nocardia wallacei]